MTRLSLAAAALALLGAAGATIFLHRAADDAVARVLDERLRGAGESAALLLGAPQPSSKRLRDLLAANALDGAYLLGSDLRVLEDATGEAGRPADLLRVDPDRVRAAFAGAESVARSWSMGELPVATGYFPIRSGGAVTAVLALEAGQPFAVARVRLRRARDAALALSLLVAAALAWVAARLGRAQQREARAETMRRMAAMAAHEIRNPLGIIRGTIELMRERAALEPRDRAALDDVLGEVERLRRLTEDFLDLGADRPLSLLPLDPGALLRDCAAALEAQFREVRVRCEVPPLPRVLGDPGRLRQVFANLLANAAQAQRAGEIELRANSEGRQVRVRVHDLGPGIPAEVRKRLFDPFVTTKEGGTGLGLAIARRLVQRHGGTLALVPGGPGTVFEVCLPQARE